MNGFIEVYLMPAASRAHTSAGLLRQQGEDLRDPEDRAERAVVRRPDAVDPKYRKQGAGHHGQCDRDVVIETGDSGPVTPVGINLPNDQAIRERYGSKSVSLSNVSEAYDKSTLPEFRSEFSWTPEETARATKWNASPAI
jgi:dipeptidyl-peptidase-3